MVQRYGGNLDLTFPRRVLRRTVAQSPNLPARDCGLIGLTWRARGDLVSSCWVVHDAPNCLEVTCYSRLADGQVSVVVLAEVPR